MESITKLLKHPNSEVALGFLYDRSLARGYGDMEIADDGSFTFPDTEWQGNLIGSGNLPNVVDMPYAEQQTLNKNVMTYGDQIKNKTRDINNSCRFRRSLLRCYVKVTQRHH